MRSGGNGEKQTLLVRSAHYYTVGFKIARLWWCVLCRAKILVVVLVVLAVVSCVLVCRDNSSDEATRRGKLVAAAGAKTGGCCGTRPSTTGQRRPPVPERRPPPQSVPVDAVGDHSDQPMLPTAGVDDGYGGQYNGGEGGGADDWDITPAPERFEAGMNGHAEWAPPVPVPTGPVPVPMAVPARRPLPMARGLPAAEGVAGGLAPVARGRRPVPRPVPRP